MGRLEKASDAAMSVPNAAASAGAIAGAISDPDGGGWFTRLASIPSRRIWGSRYNQRPAPVAPTVDPAISRAAAAQAAAQSMAATGFGWDAYAALTDGLRPAVTDPAAFVVQMNVALRQGTWSTAAVQDQLSALFTSRPEVAAAAAGAGLPHVINSDLSGAHRAINAVVQQTVAALRRAPRAIGGL